MSEHPYMPPAAAPQPTNPTETTADDRNMAMLCHLLGIITAYTLGMGFLGPLIMWLVKKDQSPFIDHHGKEALNFQLTVLVWTVGLFIVSILLIALIVGFVIVPLIILPAIVILSILALVAEIMACIAAHRGEWHRYPCCIRFV